MFYNPELTVQEQRHIRDRRLVARRHAEERRKLVDECVRAILNGDGSGGAAPR